jgi:hypothetical protein
LFSLLACKISDDFLLPKSIYLPRSYALSDATKRKTYCIAAEAATTRAGIPQWDYFASDDGSAGVGFDCVVAMDTGGCIHIPMVIITTAVLLEGFK